MSVFDIKEGTMQMSFLKPTIEQPKLMTDFLKIDFDVLANYIHPS